MRYNNNYKTAALCTQYAGVNQRWLLVYSQQAFEREQKQLRRRIGRQQTAHQQAWRKLCCQQFSCQADAIAAQSAFASTLAWWQVAATVEPIQKYQERGRPAKDTFPTVVGWRIRGDLTLNEAAVTDESQWLGRFILATNVLDEDALSDAQLLACYKQQVSSDGVIVLQQILNLTPVRLKIIQLFHPSVQNCYLLKT